MSWLHVARADTPLILAFPHGGTYLPESDFRSDWIARRDTDWHIAALYDGLVEATTIRTDISRSIIDVNRDPSGASLYPGQATTELCPTTTFDGDPLYSDGAGPDIATRRERWFDPYHAALAAEVARLRKLYDRVVVYDCHSIRSRIPRLFDGELPELNIGTNGGATCDPALTEAVAKAASARSHVVDGRFRGGWTTRHYGRPLEGIHAIQLEIAIRAYLDEPPEITPENWPPRYDPDRAAPLRRDLARILNAALNFAKGPT
ncbi:N-formylglutamate deformylase [Sphingomonas sp. SUN019]|uniref:N-formylglutamate deformylase n=1 Tax=Sphingomonas sp. SUN019 TaxID=2937788 RepID=UPI002164CEB2|nr:N-formylglutamate deformylase [Sphingomonas sp. SUN019]UVO49597.1 N-formylglutamate deformylase [Sphingomonas sp. SUN019]